MIYIRVQHDQSLWPDRSDEFVGPFPDTDIAVKHRLLYGPMAGSVVRTGTPSALVMTPGQAVDHALRRY